MNHEANWKEIEEVWIELSNCTCGTETERPCLHCDPEAFKVWYQMRFGKSAFSNTYEYLHGWSYYPLEGLVRAATSCVGEPNLLFSVICVKKQKMPGWYYSGYRFKTLKEAVIYWMQEIKSNGPQS